MILPVGIGPQEGGFQVERSLRFNSADSAYLSWTPASAGNRKTWTWSGWVKRSGLGADQIIFGAGTNNDNQLELMFDDTDRIQFIHELSNTRYIIDTLAVYRDVSAWYHIVAAIDTTQATDTNRVKLYVNGVQQTFQSVLNGYPPQNADTFVNSTSAHAIGYGSWITSFPFSGYLTEVNFIDGQALDPTSFGETDTDTGVWKPKAYTGSYGTNGFYLDFADNSSTTALGYDAAGSNDWTPNNFSVTAGAGNDSLVDTPTPYGTDTGAGGEVRGNYATLNPLANNGTLSNGNLDFADAGSDGWNNSKGTIGVSSGKFYWEMTANNIVSGVLCASVGGAKEALSQLPGQNDSFGVTYYPDGRLYYNGTSTGSWGSTYANGDIIGIALDMDNGRVWFSKNGTWQASGNPATGANPARSDLKTNDDTWFPMSGTYYSGTTCTYNFGQRPFAYSAPSGFKALCTQNLPEPTIADGSAYMNAVLYTGNGSTGRAVTGVGFAPGMVWAKGRSVAYNHWVYDTIRGANAGILPNLTNAENTNTTVLTSLDSDGFTLGNNAELNDNGATYVSWNWKANGAGVSNTAGTITSTVSANTTSGFSIGTFSSSLTKPQTIGHGLGVAPSMIIVKRRDSTSSWTVYHRSAGTGHLLLNATDAYSASNYFPTVDSSIFTLNDNSFFGGSSQLFYAFAPVAGFSAFGSYTGNGSTDGPFVYTGFRPRYVLIKETNGADSWLVMDSARSTYNVVGNTLAPNSSGAENADTGGIPTDFLSNGFKCRGSGGDYNASGGIYIYAAFAEHPFSLALAR